MKHAGIVIAATALLLSTPTWATEPDLRVGDQFVYKTSKNKFIQDYVGKDKDGNHKFKVGLKFFLLSPGMSTVSNIFGTVVSPNNGQLQLDAEKPAGKAQKGVQWEAKYKVTKKGRTIAKRRSCRVADARSKKVKAGKFAAYLVTCKISTKGKKGRSYTTTWYDQKTLRVIKHSSGKSKKKQKSRSELIKIKLVGR